MPEASRPQPPEWRGECEAQEGSRLLPPPTVHILSELAFVERTDNITGSACAVAESPYPPRLIDAVNAQLRIVLFERDVRQPESPGLLRDFLGLSLNPPGKTPIELVHREEEECYRHVILDGLERDKPAYRARGIEKETQPGDHRNAAITRIPMMNATT